MNAYLLVSGVLAILMGLAHSLIGEWLILRPLRSEGLPAVRGSGRHTKSTLRFTWHVTSVLGFGTAAILLYFARQPSFDPGAVFVLRALSVSYFICFGVSIVGSRARHPSWLVFLVIALLTWLSTSP